METIGTLRKCMANILVVLGGLGTVALVYGLITLPFWWKAEYWYSGSVAASVAGLEAFIAVTLALSHKLVPFE